MYEISSKLTIKTLKRDKWYRSGAINANFELISHISLAFS